MDFLKKKVIDETLVVNDIINQIKKFKPVISNKNTLDFVQNVEELANSLTISEIKIIHPDNVRKDW